MKLSYTSGKHAKTAKTLVEGRLSSFRKITSPSRFFSSTSNELVSNKITEPVKIGIYPYKGATIPTDRPSGRTKLGCLV